MRWTTPAVRFSGVGGRGRSRDVSGFVYVLAYPDIGVREDHCLELLPHDVREEFRGDVV